MSSYAFERTISPSVTISRFSFGDLQAHHVLARDHFDHAHAEHRQRARQILREAGDLARLHAGRRPQLEARDDRARAARRRLRLRCRSPSASFRPGATGPRALPPNTSARAAADRPAASAAAARSPWAARTAAPAAPSPPARSSRRPARGASMRGGTRVGGFLLLGLHASMRACLRSRPSATSRASLRARRAASRRRARSSRRASR